MLLFCVLDLVHLKRTFSIQLTRVNKADWQSAPACLTSLHGVRVRVQLVSVHNKEPLWVSYFSLTRKHWLEFILEELKRCRNNRNEWWETSKSDFSVSHLSLCILSLLWSNTPRMWNLRRGDISIQWINVCGCNVGLPGFSFGPLVTIIVQGVTFKPGLWGACLPTMHWSRQQGLVYSVCSCTQKWSWRRDLRSLFLTNFLLIGPDQTSLLCLPLLYWPGYFNSYTLKLTGPYTHTQPGSVGQPFSTTSLFVLVNPIHIWYGVIS